MYFGYLQINIFNVRHGHTSLEMLFIPSQGNRGKELASDTNLSVAMHVLPPVRMRSSD